MSDTKPLWPGVKKWFEEKGYVDTTTGADIAKMEGADTVSEPSTAGFGLSPYTTGTSTVYTTSTSVPGSWVTVPSVVRYPLTPSASPASLGAAELFSAMYKEMQVAVLEGADQATLVKIFSGYFSQIESAIRLENDQKELISKLKQLEAEADAKLAALKHSMAISSMAASPSITSAIGTAGIAALGSAGMVSPPTYGDVSGTSAQGMTQYKELYGKAT